MFPRGWFRLFVLVSSVAKTVPASPGEEVSPSRDLTQSEAEAILSAQTELRRHLMSTLADVGEEIARFERFHSAVVGIVQDLQTRHLDPFKSFGHDSGDHEQSAASLMAEAIFNLQGDGPNTLSDWNSLLRSIPDFVPSRPNVRLPPAHLKRVQRSGEPIVAAVLNGIRRNAIKPNADLLRDILYNYPFRDYSADLAMILDNFNRMLGGSGTSFSDFRVDPGSERPDEILSDILKYILRERSDSGMTYQTARLLAAVSDKPNTIRPRDVPELWRLFDLMLRDDYPADVIRAKNALASGVRRNRIGMDLSGVGETVKGYPPAEKLLMLVAKLTSLPAGNPFSGAVRVVYPHVKLRYLSARGRFFRPRTPSDVAFLLDSFPTVPDRVDPTVIHDIFSLSDFDEALKDFDYSRYSRPRPLVLDMVRGLLNNPGKFPVCNVVLLSYFLRENQHAFQTSDDAWDGGSIFPDPATPPETTTAVGASLGSEPGLSTVTSPREKIQWRASVASDDLYPTLPTFTPATAFLTNPPAVPPQLQLQTPQTSVSVAYAATSEPPPQPPAFILTPPVLPSSILTSVDPSADHSSGSPDGTNLPSTAPASFPDSPPFDQITSASSPSQLLPTTRKPSSETPEQSISSDSYSLTPSAATETDVSTTPQRFSSKP